MALALSADLRGGGRGRDVLPWRRRSLRRRPIDGDQVAAAIAPHGQRSAAAAWRRQALASAREPCRRDPRADRRDAGHHACRDRGASRAAARPDSGAQHGLAVARLPWARLQEERRTPPNSSGLTSGSGGWPGSRCSPSWSPNASPTSTRPAARPSLAGLWGPRGPTRDGQALRPGAKRCTLPGTCPALQGLLALSLAGIG